jgi:hypothetical protein
MEQSPRRGFAPINADASRKSMYPRSSVLIRVTSVLSYINREKCAQAPRKE